MNKTYRIILFVFILIATVILTVQHYTDPIYKFKVGRNIDVEDKRIENWGGRFGNNETLYLGFRTRLDENTVVTLEIETSTGEEVTKETFIVIDRSDFYYLELSPNTLDAEDYMAYLIVDDEILESYRFVLDAPEEQ